MNNEKYVKYLKQLDGYLNNFFEQQKPYICCKEGCSHCCQKGSYPMSRLEFEYLKEGFSTLSAQEKEAVESKITKLKDKKVPLEGLYHECPFLVNDRCSVYDYRSIICRTYGLLVFYENEDGSMNYGIPACASLGLNYAGVYDEDSQTISIEKYQLLNVKSEPLAYNLSLRYLYNCEIALDIDFGEGKSLIEWLKTSF